MDIAAAQNMITIEVRNIRANSRWAQFVVHAIPAHIGTTYKADTYATMTSEITKAKNFTKSQLPN